MNAIGLEGKVSAQLSEKLNLLLSDYQIFYQNLRAYHWNIKGNDFFELHLKFEEFYNDAQVKIDEIAERILTLGGIPLHTYSDYIKYSDIKERSQIEDGKKAVDYILYSLGRRGNPGLTSDAKDEGSLSLMSGYISEQES